MSSSLPFPSSTNSRFSDIRGDDWITRWLPNTLRPYARLSRLDRPIGWWLLLLPCWWSLGLARPAWHHLGLFGLFWIGAVVMRGAGCTLNDIVDRHFDAAVERTRTRPIPAGEVTVLQALVYLLLQLLIGAAVLFSLNRPAILLGFAVLTLIATYPLMKRITFWPQLFLGLNFNWGVLIAWTTVAGRIDPPAIALYVAGIAWTLGYDTIYAHQDRADDIKIGVKSTALLFGTGSRRWIAGFYAATWFCVLIAFYGAHADLMAYLALPVLGAHFIWQVAGWDMDDQADCLRRFKSNRTAGLIIAAGCFAAHL